MPSVVNYRESLQYDGTNGTFICGTFADVDMVSDTGSVLTFVNGENGNVAINSGDWVIKDAPFPGELSVRTNTVYGNQFTELPGVPALSVGAGYALTPSITGSGGTANVAVDLDTTFSGTGYLARAVLAGTSALLADLDITSVAITDSNTVTVTVQNNGLLALAGATVIVTAGELTFA